MRIFSLRTTLTPRIGHRSRGLLHTKVLDQSTRSQGLIMRNPGQKQITMGIKDLITITGQGISQELLNSNFTIATGQGQVTTMTESIQVVVDTKVQQESLNTKAMEVVVPSSATTAPDLKVAAVMPTTVSKTGGIRSHIPISMDTTTTGIITTMLIKSLPPHLLLHLPPQPLRKSPQSSPPQQQISLQQPHLPR